jgi:hypothetical protein
MLRRRKDGSQRNKFHINTCRESRNKFPGIVAVASGVYAGAVGSLTAAVDILRAGSKNTPLLQRRILIGALIVLIAAFGLYLRITMV